MRVYGGIGWLVVLSLLAPARDLRGQDIVRVERDPAGRGWVATWQFDTPVRALRFERPAQGFRSRTFEVLTPRFRFDRDGEFEVLRSDGTSAREVRVRFPEFDEQLSREYEFFRRFTDGGVAMYTGHLVARPADDAGERAFVRRFRFIPPSGAAVIVDGERRDGPVEWIDATGRGTYVYFGSAVPVASEDVIAIVDPGLPQWIARRTRDALPRLFALYRERLDAAPPARPFVLFDYDPGTSAGYEYGGGILPGVIQLGVQGTAWDTESSSATIELLHFLAHEAAHVWNGEIAHYPGSEDAWMHEGGADALAERALMEMQLIDEARFLDYQTAALNDCRSGLVATSLRASTREGRPQLVYACGNIIALLTEAVLRPHGADLFDFWHALIVRAASADGRYQADDYISAWRTLGAGDSDVAALEGFLDGTMTPDRLSDALGVNGIVVEEADPPPAFGQELARTALAHLMAADCGGRYSFRVTEDGFALGDNVSCTTLVPGATVAAVAGHDVQHEGDRAYDRVQSCTQTVTIRLRTASATRELPVACSAGLPARPGYVRIVRIPRER